MYTSSIYAGCTLISTDAFVGRNHITLFDHLINQVLCFAQEIILIRWLVWHTMSYLLGFRPILSPMASTRLNGNFCFFLQIHESSTPVSLEIQAFTAVDTATMPSADFYSSYNQSLESTLDLVIFVYQLVLYGTKRNWSHLSHGFNFAVSSAVFTNRT